VFTSAAQNGGSQVVVSVAKESFPIDSGTTERDKATANDSRLPEGCPWARLQMSAGPEARETEPWPMHRCRAVEAVALTLPG
jgi:hypothetical protein